MSAERDNNREATPGNVKITSAIIVNAEGKGVNIKDIIHSIDIFEDISNAFISGNVLVGDSISLSEVLPLQGEEMIVFELETPGFTEDGKAESDLNYKRVFTVHLYKMEMKENISLKHVLYQLSFMSLDAVRDMNKKISRTFRGRVSDIAKQILEEESYLGTNKELLIEPSSNNTAFTANFWTPSKCLMFAAERALSDMNNPNYLFFENAEGFTFASLDALYSYAPVTRIVRDQRPRPVNQDESNDIEQEWSKILDISVSDQYNYIHRATSGMYGSTIYSWDSETKKLNYKTVDGWRDYGESRIRLNADLPVKANRNVDTGEAPAPFLPEACMFTEVTSLNNYNGAPTHAIEMSQRRATILNQAQFNKISVQVFGRFDYTVGRTIDVIIYADREMLEGDDPAEAFDKVLTGRYLITAVNHSITRTAHYTNMELCKDSYTAL